MFTTPQEGPYESLLRKVLDKGAMRTDRTGTGTKSLFGTHIEYDLAEGFPLITSKRVGLKTVARELLWFLSGVSNVRPLLEQNVHIWTEWVFEPYLKAIGRTDVTPASPEWGPMLKEFEQRIIQDDEFAAQYGELGPVYGVQWRHWPTEDGGEVDQIARLIEGIKRDPMGRRHIVSAWNVAEIHKMKLPPCHAFFQFYVESDGSLSCKLEQRSADMFLGVPFNLASYGLLIHMVAQQCDLKPGRLIWSGGDTHIYRNHIDQVREQLSREPRSLPTLILKQAPDIFSYTIDDISVAGYEPHDAIRGEISV